MTRPTARKPSGSRTLHHASPSRRRKVPSRRRLIVLAAAAGLAFILVILLWAALARRFTPLSNTSRKSFDAIVILGTPADDDGNPTPQLLDRVAEGVREYERGVAPRILVTGAAAHNRFVEADVMARIAEAKGVPASVILEEPRALDTIQNACYSGGILKEHGWHSAEIISSPSHLPRAAMIFSRQPLSSWEWRMHAAPENLTPGSYSRGSTLVEIFKTARYLAWSRWTESCNP